MRTWENWRKGKSKPQFSFSKSSTTKTAERVKTLNTPFVCWESGQKQKENENWDLKILALDPGKMKYSTQLP